MGKRNHQPFLRLAYRPGFPDPMVPAAAGDAERYVSGSLGEPHDRLPRRLFVYLALLIFTFVLPPLLNAIDPVLVHAKSSAPTQTLSDQDFQQYIGAESSTRTQLSADTTGTIPPTSKKATYIIDGSIADYHALSRSTHQPNMDRRALILSHYVGLPLDEKTLTTGLSENLRRAGTPAPEIAAEIRLWRLLYAKDVSARATLPVISKVLGDDRARIVAMHLGFLQNLALLNLYQRAGAPREEVQIQQKIQAQASDTAFRNIGVYGVPGLAGLAGVFLLFYFVVCAARRRWVSVGRAPTVKPRLSFGDLVECFLFYLTLYRCTGIVLGSAMLATHWRPDPHQYLLLDAAIQLGVGTTAVFYVARKASARGVTLADIGLTTRGSLLGQVGFGILGYCATLPVILVAGYVGRALFRHNPSTVPNPILPLMVGAHDPLARGLIFLMASVAAPLLEETFFRGVLFTGLRNRYGWTVSAALSALCFAVVHPLQDWLPIFTLGFSFAIMREMRQSVIPGMTAHFLQNTLTFAMLTSLFS